MGTHPIFESNFDCLTERMKLRDGCLERSRTDLHLTSTGKGHFYHQSLQPFPPANFERHFEKEPPAGLRSSNLDKAEQFRTTTGSAHGEKVQKPVHRNTLYKKAPGHWNVHYMDRTIGKLNTENKRNFTMGDRVSEMTSKYIPKENYRNPTEHIRSSKVALGGPARTTQADNTLITHINPYMTTTRKDHRPFTSTDMRNYPKKDALTFWEFENYPKVWGHGSNDGKNIPPRRAPNSNDSMRDLTMGGLEIKSETRKIATLPKPRHVPNKGLKSLVQASYIRHAGAPKLDLTHVEPPQPFSAYFNHGRGRNADTSNCPKMYTTEYGFYGDNQQVRV